MKAITRKYFKLEQAIFKVTKELDGKYVGRSFIQPTSNRQAVLHNKRHEYETKQKTLLPLISKEDFENDLESLMCCTWEDFKGL